MNPRIRELVRESHLDVYGLGKERYKWEYTVGKFAELIVQECIDIVSPYAVRMDNFDGGHPIADLKKHFVVD